MLLTILGWVGLFVGGFLVGLLVILLIKIKKTRKIISDKIEEKKGISACDKQRVDAIVKAKRKAYKKKNRFHVFKTVAGFKPKTSGYFAMYGDIVNEVAKIQNADSKYPVLEFSVRQAFEFIGDVTVDLEGVLDSLGMPMLRGADLSFVYGIVDFTSKFNEIKIVKATKKISKPLKPILSIIRLLNPVRWVTTLITAIFTASLVRDLYFALADIVAWQFSKFYAQCKNENLVSIA